MRALDDAFAPATFPTASYTLIRACTPRTRQLRGCRRGGCSLLGLHSHETGLTNLPRVGAEGERDSKLRRRRRRGGKYFEEGVAERPLYRLANTRLCSHHPGLAGIGARDSIILGPRRRQSHVFTPSCRNWLLHTGFSTSHWSSGFQQGCSRNRHHQSPDYPQLTLFSAGRLKRRQWCLPSTTARLSCLGTHRLPAPVCHRHTLLGAHSARRNRL